MCALGKDIINLEKMYELLVLVYKELQRTKKHFSGPEYSLQLRPEKKHLCKTLLGCRNVNLPHIYTAYLCLHC